MGKFSSSLANIVRSFGFSGTIGNMLCNNKDTILALTKVRFIASGVEDATLPT